MAAAELRAEAARLLEAAAELARLAADEARQRQALLARAHAHELADPAASFRHRERALARREREEAAA